MEVFAALQILIFAIPIFGVITTYQHTNFIEKHPVLFKLDALKNVWLKIHQIG